MQIQKVWFLLWDNGDGVPAEKIDNLFKKFYQMDTSATRKHNGTGLVLVMCKGMVKAHGGNIWVDQNHYGEFSKIFNSYG